VVALPLLLLAALLVLKMPSPLTVLVLVELKAGAAVVSIVLVVATEAVVVNVARLASKCSNLLEMLPVVTSSMPSTSQRYAATAVHKRASLAEEPCNASNTACTAASPPEGVIVTEAITEPGAKVTSTCSISRPLAFPPAAVKSTWVTAPLTRWWRRSFATSES